MQSYTLDHVGDDVLRQDLAASTAHVHRAMAIHLAYIAEFDARRLYAPAGYSCMHAYCVRELRLSPDSASKRIQAARAARNFPALFPALAEGQLSLTAVCELAPHLSDENCAHLMERAAHLSKSDIRELLASRLGIVAHPEFVHPLPGTQLNSLHAPAHVRATSPDTETLAATDVPKQPESPEHSTEGVPNSAKQFLVQFTLNEIAHAKLRYAQALLSHAVPSGELADVFERALDALIPALETKKFRARRSGRAVKATVASADPRHIPAHIQRAVWDRDHGRCSFVSANGVRCGADKLLEYDHIVPVAHGGQSTAGNIRLRCHAHNQYEAERIFGANHMAAKREERQQARTRAKPATTEQTEDVLAGLVSQVS